MNSSYKIASKFDAGVLLDGRINFFDGMIEVDGVGSVPVRVRVSKADLENGSIGLENDHLIPSGVVVRIVEAQILNERDRQARKANEAARLQDVTGHLPEMTGASETQKVFASRVRNDKYAGLKEQIEFLTKNPQMAVRHRIRPTDIDLLPQALEAIETNADARFWLDHCASLPTLVWHLRQQA